MKILKIFFTPHFLRSLQKLPANLVDVEFIDIGTHDIYR